MTTRESKPDGAAIREMRILVLSATSADAEQVGAALGKNGTSVDTHWVGSKGAFAEALETFLPDVVVTDQQVGHFSAIDALDVVREARPITPVIVLTAVLDERATVAGLRAGVEDVVSKSQIARLPASVQAAMKARRKLAALSPRQLQVLRLVAEGNTTREVAKRLRVSVKTAETHRTEVMKRLELHDVVSVVRYAIRVGIVPATEI